MQGRVVVTGIGLVSPVGIGIEAAWRTMQTDTPKAQLVEVPAARSEDRQFRVFLTPDYRIEDVTETAVPGPQLAEEGADRERDVKHLIAATGMAIADAELRSMPDLDLGDVGLIVADEHPGIETLSRGLYGETDPADQPRPGYDDLSDQIFGLNTFLVPFTVARSHGLGGECYFVNSACASGLTALDNAAAQVRSGRTPVAIAAAADDPLSSGKFRWFADRDLYAADGELRPFDQTASGTVFGDGGCALVVEDEAHALGRGARIYGRLSGAGFTQDAWRVKAPHPGKASQARSVERALREAGRCPSDVDLVVPHGTGISVLDKYEVRTLHRTWTDPATRPTCLPLKPYIGHNLGGSSLVESALLLKAMSEACVPAVPNRGEPADPFDLNLSTDWTAKKIGVAVKTAAAFGGFYGSIVLETV